MCEWDQLPSCRLRHLKLARVQRLPSGCANAWQPTIPQGFIFPPPHTCPPAAVQPGHGERQPQPEPALPQDRHGAGQEAGDTAEAGGGRQRLSLALAGQGVRQLRTGKVC